MEHQRRFQEKESLERLLGDRDILSELIDSFLRTTPELMLKIKEAICTGNPDELDMQAHTLKSSLGGLGANQATELAYALERMGKEKNMQYASTPYEQLVDEVNALNQELMDYLRHAA